MKILVLALIALAGCTTQEWHCPKAPKIVPKFGVGEHVAFTVSYAVWSCQSNPEYFNIDKGDTGIVTDIEYWGVDAIRYSVHLDKTKEGEVLDAKAYEGRWGSRTLSDLEAVVYPDPALAPRK